MIVFPQRMTKKEFRDVPNLVKNTRKQGIWLCASGMLYIIIIYLLNNLDKLFFFE